MSKVYGNTPIKRLLPPEIESPVMIYVQQDCELHRLAMERFYARRKVELDERRKRRKDLRENVGGREPCHVRGVAATLTHLASWRKEGKRSWERSMTMICEEG